MGESASARSVGTAKSGVPAKAMRSMRHMTRADARGRPGRSAGALAAFFFEFSPDALALEPRQVIDEQLAGQMIHLVLQAYRRQTLQLTLEWLAVRILGAHLHARRALDLLEYVGHRQAAFFRHLDAVACHNLGVDVDLRLVLLAADIHHEQPPMDIDLRGRQSDPRGGIHGLQHVGDQLLERGIELLHRVGTGAQPGIGEFQYGQQGHRYSL